MVRTKRKPAKKKNTKRFSKRIIIFVVLVLVLCSVFLFFNYFQSENTSQSESAQIDTTRQKPIQPRSLPLEKGYSEFVSKIGNYAFDYPNDWDVSTSEHPEPLKDKFPGQESIYILSNNRLESQSRYMCVNFRTDSRDFYKLEGGEIIDTLPNNMKIYQKVYKNTQGKQSVWLYLTSEIAPGLYGSVVSLPNGNDLQVISMFNCIEGDDNYLNLQLDEQLHSPEYQEAVKIFKSIRL